MSNALLSTVGSITMIVVGILAKIYLKNLDKKDGR